MEKNKERLEIIQKEKEYERLGKEFLNKDVENDPPSKVLLPNDVDYLYKKIGNKFKRFIAVRMGNALRRDSKKKYKVTLTGLENIEGLSSPAIITGNHFAPLDSICETLIARHINKHKKMYIVKKEGNFQMPGAYGFLFKYCDTLPLSSNVHTMQNFYKALDEVFKKGHFVLIYPEQSMWWNYRKPRPHMVGASYIASKFNVPIVPCFVTMEDQEELDEFGFPLQKFTVHILKPLYPDKNKSIKQNARELADENYKMCVETYEKVYGKKIVYGEDDEESI